MADIRSSNIINQPVDVEDPDLNIVPDDSPLKPGVYVFSLVVTDDMGQHSEAATWTVEVRDRPRVEITGPAVVAFNQSIPLTARVSSGGPIKTYSWSVTSG